jgi:hypothetical protein
MLDVMYHNTPAIYVTACTIAGPISLSICVKNITSAGQQVTPDLGWYSYL